MASNWMIDNGGFMGKGGKVMDMCVQYWAGLHCKAQLDLVCT